ncbi:hypothetical protein COCSADRAFT_321645 [Bipolaris sorokiniana ND90Pr]|uniref:Uncharacterized protein n=1 Tax=Cochliobolus sativus (strain ND90Pr / ATCC 201652) TaxID=665912 RepID=M2T579_COCSN|nr:uncharacterized protein COCSADRAFT_321645 [Bipolaris sorokiniana ND90Pr]EMD64137.1 hypothetical protein COCSADRAFT_321645 [Bipolaris sorokiniana ND90Pr]
MVVTNGESPPPFPAQQSVHAYIHTHTHTFSLSHTHTCLHTPTTSMPVLLTPCAPASLKMLLSIPEADRLSYSRYRHPSRPSTSMLPRAYPTLRPSALS